MKLVSVPSTAKPAASTMASPSTSPNTRATSAATIDCSRNRAVPWMASAGVRERLAHDNRPSVRSASRPNLHREVEIIEAYRSL